MLGAPGQLEFLSAPGVEPGEGGYVEKSRKLVAVGMAVFLVAVACSSSKKSATTATTAAGGTSGGTTATTSSTAGNTASDVGVTPTQITVGNVSTLTGPIPGLFAGGPAGTDAYFQYINSQGGVNGRKLVLKTGDDGLNCNQYLTQVQALAPSVFGFVGSWSDFDNCGANYFTANPTIPDFHYLLQNQTYGRAQRVHPAASAPGVPHRSLPVLRPEVSRRREARGRALGLHVDDDLAGPVRRP